MPYIKKEIRVLFDSKIEMLVDTFCNDTKFDPCELEYVVFNLMKKIVKIKGIKYDLLNALIGAVECCKLEFIRREILVLENGTFDDLSIPCIKKGYSVLFDSKIDILVKTLCDGTEFNPGELNYVIFKLMKGIVKRVTHGLLKDLIIALECSKLEFNHKVIADYEDLKIKENGDVE